MPGRFTSGHLDPPVTQGSFTTEHTVTAGDTSAVGPVYYARLIDWQGHCRERAGIAGAPLFSSDITGDYAVLTQSCHCEYIKEISYGDLIAIRLTIVWVRMHLMKAEFRYHHINIPGEPGGELVARGEQTWASTLLVDGHYEPCPWPHDIASCAAELGADMNRAQIQDPPNYLEARLQR
ncbi:acyl-CoA thioesterase [Nocardia suismassiliense]|uniref:acyl-CoA thioesterase n=1 Tax=Nocardia suismassiliense TaxID=2077092 RepID=UPI000D1DD6E9|nr:acyl-CoA thioesterase [Nocardia suismassiliense]